MEGRIRIRLEEFLVRLERIESYLDTISTFLETNSGIFTSQIHDRIFYLIDLLRTEFSKSKNVLSQATDQFGPFQHSLSPSIILVLTGSLLLLDFIWDRLEPTIVKYMEAIWNLIDEMHPANTVLPNVQIFIHTSRILLRLAPPNETLNSVDFLRKENQNAERYLQKARALN